MAARGCWLFCKALTRRTLFPFWANKYSTAYVSYGAQLRGNMNITIRKLTVKKQRVKATTKHALSKTWVYVHRYKGPPVYQRECPGNGAMQTKCYINNNKYQNLFTSGAIALKNMLNQIKTLIHTTK